MKIVINIPEEIYEIAKQDKWKYPADDVYNAIKNGTLLSEGHGDLIDRDELELDTEWDDYYDGFISYSEIQIKNAEVIIEADKEN